ncbi:hypothetical protein KY290_036265 [Solanum tuberosum]|uniref:Uncharacterized protein n=1 Tax=Solanum tuberosum TaxID=4113 RepID=A0ABQ7TSN0_SOLTU|nr:hypothetical protein KY290_036265 [Solanum tuberosum]
MNGQSMWPQHDNILLLPPRVVRQSTKGRKQKKRKKELDEVGASRTKAKRKQKYLGCSRCHKLGHNTRTCKYNLLQTESQNVSPLYHESSSSCAPTKLPVRRAAESRANFNSTK